MRPRISSSRSLIQARHRMAFILCASLLGCLALATPSSVAALIAGLRTLAANLVNNTPVRPVAPPERGQRPRPTPCNSCPPPSSKRIYAPAIELREAERCEIVLNSRSASPIAVTPTFYTINGDAVVGNPVTLQPAEIRFVPVEQLMPEALRGRHRWGGIALSYTGNVLEVWAQITFHGVGGGSVDETFNILEEPGSDTREAVWLMPKKSTAVIALGNSSNVPIRTTAEFSDGESEEIEIPEGATKFIRRHARQRDTESVKLTTIGPEGSVRVTGFIVADDQSFTSSIRFHDTKKTVQPNLYATNLRLKKADSRIVLKNTSQVEVSARPRFFTASGEQDNPVDLPPITLRPHEAVEIDLSALRAAAASRTDLDSVSVQVINSGAPGSLIGAAYSARRDTQLTYDVPLRDYGKVRNTTGSYPWRIDNDYSTVVVVTNAGNQPARFQVEIRYPGGPYSIRPRELAVGQTATFDLRKMRDEQQPDRLGKTLPLDLDRGQFHWSLVATVGEAHLVGRAEVVSRSARVASSYSCPVCCPDSGPYGGFNPNSYTVLIDGFTNTGSSGEYQDCYGYPYFSSIWWTGLWTWDPGVATMNASTEELHGESAGSTLASGSWDLVYWYTDNMDCYQSFYTNSDNAPVDVSPVTFIDVSEVGGTNSAEFFGGIRFASLNISSCGGERFGVKIRFRLAANTTISNFNSTVSSSGMFALTNNPVDDCSVCYYGNDNPPYTITYLRKVRDSGNRAVTHTLQGTSDGTPFTTQAVVTLVCQ